MQSDFSMVLAPLTVQQLLLQDTTALCNPIRNELCCLAVCLQLEHWSLGWEFCLRSAGERSSPFPVMRDMPWRLGLSTPHGMRRQLLLCAWRMVTATDIAVASDVTSYFENSEPGRPEDEERAGVWAGASLRWPEVPGVYIPQRESWCKEGKSKRQACTR